MSIQDDINDILAKLVSLETQINTMRGVANARRTEGKCLREDVDKNKRALYALLDSTAFSFASQMKSEMNDEEDEDEDEDEEYEEFKREVFTNRFLYH